MKQEYRYTSFYECAVEVPIYLLTKGNFIIFTLKIYTLITSHFF